jgi:hypothetical protein
MPRELTPAQAIERIERWRKAGFNVAIVDGALVALGHDRDESRMRAPRRLGRLAATVRIVRPTASRAAKTGEIRLGLGAGSRSKLNPVAYASVLQRGLVGYPGRDKTRAHVIRPQGSGWLARWRPGRGWAGIEGSGKRVLSFVVGGRRIFTTRVNHPGSRFQARNYLRINQDRVRVNVTASVVASAGREL